ncbi:MAG: GTPase ObgE [Armatimonadetes bacterium]|nr:GTPase ObgE [Armatimonadota bacterium]
MDSAIVRLTSGKGGNGAASFHREKHVPRGGPNGADGGRGGDIVFVADRGARTLYDFKLRDHYEAPNGTDAHGNKSGKDGNDLTIRVPVGTVVFEEDGETMVDLDTDGASFVVAKGGRGGRGNLHFTNSVRQAPTIAENGEPAETVAVRLELKLLADVGLIGLPNAGKSTIVSACTASKAKIGAYPFTTIVPNLGVVSIGDVTFVMADMPGLIEGASEGVGLGVQFLKHVERTRVLVHVVDAFPLDGTDPVENYKTVESELAKYSEDLASAPRLIALNKSDLGPPGSTDPLAESLTGSGHPVFVVSAATGQGLQPLLYAAAEALAREDAKPKTTVVRPKAVDRLDDAWEIVSEGGTFIVKGKRIERAVEMTRLSNSESLRHLHRRLHRMGVIDKLREAGAEDGDNVRVGGFEFTFMEGR